VCVRHSLDKAVCELKQDDPPYTHRSPAAGSWNRASNLRYRPDLFVMLTATFNTFVDIATQQMDGMTMVY